MGFQHFETTFAVWYSHDAERQQKAMRAFQAELADHAEKVRRVAALTVSKEARAHLSKAEEEQLGRDIKEVGFQELSDCFIAPRELTNNYSIAVWLPTGSKAGWGEANEHARLAQRFRELAARSGAHVTAAWDFDMGEAVGVRSYYCRHDEEDDHLCDAGTDPVVEYAGAGYEQE